MRKITTPDYELYPRHLTPEQVKDPYKVLADFFSFFGLPEARKDMKDILKMTVISRDFHKLLEQKERSDLIWFHGWLEKLIEANHIIYERKRKRVVKKK